MWTCQQWCNLTCKRVSPCEWRQKFQSNKNCHFVIYEKLDNSNDVKKILKIIAIANNQ